MSGKTAKRARREARERASFLLDADQVFSAVLSQMMSECGIDYGMCPTEQVDLTIAMCCAEADLCWDELVLWVVCGDDQKAKTLEISAAARRLGR